MATATPLDEESSVNDDVKQPEIFSIIWLNPNPQETRQTKQKLRSIVNRLKIFQDIEARQ